MNEKKLDQLKEYIAAIIILLIFSVFLYAVFPKPGDVPQKLFERQGYDVRGITFEKEHGPWWKGVVYKTSEPLYLSNGEACDRWQVMAFGTGAIQYMVPYYENSEKRKE